MKHILSTAISLLLMIAVFFVAGCTGDQWQKAAQASEDLITTVSSAQDAEIGFYKDLKNTDFSFITHDEHVRIQLTFERIAKLDKDLNNAIKNGASGQDITAAYKAATDGITAALNDGSLGVKNPAVQASLTATIVGARALLTTIYLIATNKPTVASAKTTADMKHVADEMKQLALAGGSDLDSGYEIGLAKAKIAISIENVNAELRALF